MCATGARAVEDRGGQEWHDSGIGTGEAFHPSVQKLPQLVYYTKKQPNILLLRDVHLIGLFGQVSGTYARTSEGFQTRE